MDEYFDEIIKKIEEKEFQEMALIESSISVSKYILLSKNIEEAKRLILNLLKLKKEVFDFLNETPFRVNIPITEGAIAQSYLNVRQIINACLAFKGDEIMLRFSFPLNVNGVKEESKNNFLFRSKISETGYLKSRAFAKALFIKMKEEGYDSILLTQSGDKQFFLKLEK